MVILLALLATLSGGGYLFMQQKQFGVSPKGARLERIQQSPNYKNGSFQNISETPVMTGNGNIFKITEQYFKKVEGKEPTENVPSIKTDLNVLNDSVPSIVWFGHSSYLIKINGKHILVDPVFSGNASPISMFGKNYMGSNIYGVDDLPAIDLVVISHDHYDHLDYPTIIKLKNKAKHFLAPLGVGAHLEYWGIGANNITELDWWEQTKMDSIFTFTAAPARHFSGRKFKRGETLWTSYVLQTPTHKIYIGGDSGYDKHFKEIGEKHGPFDIAILECGQYNYYWSNIHMMPEETAQAAKELNSKLLFPVHNSKFTLALHPWKEPLERVTQAAQQLHLPVVTPIIGQPILLGDSAATKKWWLDAR